MLICLDFPVGRNFCSQAHHLTWGTCKGFAFVLHQKLWLSHKMDFCVPTTCLWSHPCQGSIPFCHSLADIQEVNRMQIPAGYVPLEQHYQEAGVGILTVHRKHRLNGTVGLLALKRCWQTPSMQQPSSYRAASETETKMPCLWDQLHPTYDTVTVKRYQRGQSKGVESCEGEHSMLAQGNSFSKGTPTLRKNAYL